MLQLKNTTPFQATFFAAPDPQGIDCVYAIVKATFALGDRLSLAEQQEPVSLAEEYYGEPGRSSIRKPTDISLIKPGTDVLLAGSAYTPLGTWATQTTVSLRVGPIQKVVRVTGDRNWGTGVVGWMSSPVPFEKMPLTWERAFGGTEADGGPPRFEPRNPVGTGFQHRSPDGPVRVPNLEDPREPISSRGDRPAPANFAPICAHWEPRCRYAGTYDEQWTRTRAPYLPRDFDPRFLQIAPADQVVPGYLGGDELVQVSGASPSGEVRFQLPAVRPKITFRLDEETHARPANLDTVLIEPDQGRVLLVWRAAFQCDKKVLRVREIGVGNA